MSSLSPLPLHFPTPPYFTKCSSHGGSRIRHEETVEMKLEGSLTNACETASFSSFVVLQFLEHQIYIKRNELFFGFLHSLFDSPPITSHFKVLIFSVEYWFVTRLLPWNRLNSSPSVTLAYVKPFLPLPPIRNGHSLRGGYGYAWAMITIPFLGKHSSESEHVLECFTVVVLYPPSWKIPKYSQSWKPIKSKSLRNWPSEIAQLVYLLMNIKRARYPVTYPVKQT